MWGWADWEKGYEGPAAPSSFLEARVCGAGSWVPKLHAQEPPHRLAETEPRLLSPPSRLAIVAQERMPSGSVSPKTEPRVSGVYSKQ